MKNLFIIQKRLNKRIKNALKILTENQVEKDNLIYDIRKNHLQYYMIPISHINRNRLALVFNQVKSIT